MTTNFFSPLSFVEDFRFGIRDPGWVKNQDPGLTSRIRITAVEQNLKPVLQWLL